MKMRAKRARGGAARQATSNTPARRQPPTPSRSSVRLPCPVCGGPVRWSPRGDAAPGRNARRPRQMACARCHYRLYDYPRLCVGFVVTRGDDVLLLVRGHMPRRGYVDLPGGFLEAGEDFERAARRELYEETGLRVGPARVLGTYWDEYALPGFGSFPTLNVYYLAPWRSGTPKAGDDAAHAEWVSLPEARRRAPRFAWRHMARVLKDLGKAHRSKSNARLRALRLVTRSTKEVDDADRL